ncbi:MAG: RNA-binding domain-containing protein [Candidatus Lokiarchaeota archaeon]
MLAHSIILELFVHPEEDQNKIIEKLLSLIPFDIKEEKVALKRKSTFGFNQERIIVLSVTLTKKRHIEEFLENFIKRIGDHTKKTMSKEIDRRLDNKFNFYIRLDKQKLVDQGELEITEAGDCIYIKVKIAVFPQKRDKAIQEIENYLT